MARMTTTAKVGAFTALTLVAAVVILRFVSDDASGTQSYTVYARMQDASGIAERSQVRVAGIPVGQVRKVYLDGDRARIDIAIRGDVPLYDDSAVAKVSTSLLGEKYLAIAPGTEGRRELEDGDQIPVVLEGTSTDDILRDVAQIAKDAKEVSGSLARTVGTDEGEEEIRRTLENVAKITDDLRDIVEENRQSVRDILQTVERITAKSEPDIDAILGNVRESTDDVREMLAKAEVEGGESGEVRRIVEKVDRASTSLESALAHVDSVAGRIDRGEGSLGRLTKDEHLIDQVEGVAEGVGEFVGSYRRLQTVVNLRADYQFLSSSLKSYVELRLQPAEDKYYAIEIVNDPRGRTRYEQIDVDTTNPNDPPHYREVRTVTTNEFRFSFQFAKSFGPFTGRFGIKESTGGVGLDLLVLDDRFEVKQDWFGFSETVLPRWRLSLSYEFVRHLWLIGGVDDILSDDRRDYFVGLQLRFNDRDLKALLPFAGGAAGAL